MLLEPFDELGAQLRNAFPLRWVIDEVILLTKAFIPRDFRPSEDEGGLGPSSYILCSPKSPSKRGDDASLSSPDSATQGIAQGKTNAREDYLIGERVKDHLYSPLGLSSCWGRGRAPQELTPPTPAC